MGKAAGAGRSFAESLQRLESAQKPGPGVPAYTRWVNRKAGRVLAAGAYSVGLKPDQVTALSGLVSLIGIGTLALAPINPATAALVVFLLLLGYALDSADGQVARLSGQSSKAGEWLDHVVDSARVPAFHFAVGSALFRSLEGDTRWWALLALAYALLASTWFFAQILAEQLRTGGQSGSEPPANTPNWVSLAKLPYDSATPYLLVLLLPWPVAFTVGYLGLFVFSALVAGASMRRRYRELQTIS